MGWIKELQDLMTADKKIKIGVYTTGVLFLLIVVAMGFFLIKNASQGHAVKAAGVELPEINETKKDTPFKLPTIVNTPITKVKIKPLPPRPLKSEILPPTTNNKPIDSSKDASKYSLNNPTFNGPTQLGDHNTQNNNFDPTISPTTLDSIGREVNNMAIAHKMKSKRVEISAEIGSSAGRILDKIREYLISKGYTVNNTGASVAPGLKGVSIHYYNVTRMKQDDLGQGRPYKSEYIDITVGAF